MTISSADVVAVDDVRLIVASVDICDVDVVIILVFFVFVDVDHVDFVDVACLSVDVGVERGGGTRSVSARWVPSAGRGVLELFLSFAGGRGAERSVLVVGGGGAAGAEHVVRGGCCGVVARGAR